ncbi:hypothetical protein JW826_00045 [Candidatus Woesearchaeota archaeon]|nr:hypothetical protein [Candidatus Woesearchaeota archaeon]
MIPNLFSKLPIPGKIPAGLERAVRDLKRKNRTKESFLRATFDFLRQKYTLSRMKVILEFPELFKTDLEYLWRRTGHLHCTNVNYLLRVMLVKSGLFKDSDIKPMNTNTWFVMPHQYLRVDVTDKNAKAGGARKEIDVDISTYDFGIPYGSHAGGLRCGSLFPKRDNR